MSARPAISKLRLRRSLSAPSLSTPTLLYHHPNPHLNPNPNPNPQHTRQAWAEPLATVRESITKLCVETLYQYRSTCASTSPPGQLILPESLKLMPLYALALLKSDVRGLGLGLGLAPTHTGESCISTVDLSAFETAGLGAEVRSSQSTV